MKPCRRGGGSRGLAVIRLRLDVLDHAEADQFCMQYHCSVATFGDFQQPLFERHFERQQIDELIQNLAKTLVVDPYLWWSVGHGSGRN